MKNLTKFVAEGGISTLKENAACLTMRKLIYDDETDDVILIIDYKPKTAQKVHDRSPRSKETSPLSPMRPLSPLSPITPLSQTSDTGPISTREYCENYFDRNAAKEVPETVLKVGTEGFNNSDEDLAKAGESEGRLCNLGLDDQDPVENRQDKPHSSGDQLLRSTESSQHRQALQKECNLELERQDLHASQEEKRRENVEAINVQGDNEDDVVYEALEANIIRNPQARGMMPASGMLTKQPSTTDFLAKSRFNRVYASGTPPTHNIKRSGILSSVDNRPSNYDPDLMMKTTSTDWRNESQPTSPTELDHEMSSVIAVHGGSDLSSPRTLVTEPFSPFRKSKSMGLFRRASLDRRSSIGKRARSLFKRSVKSLDLDEAAEYQNGCDSLKGQENSQQEGMFATLGNMLASGWTRIWPSSPKRGSKNGLK